MTPGFDTYSLFGWVGIAFIILAYVFLSTGKLKTNYVLYHLLNLFGAMGLIVSTFTTHSWPAFTLTLILVGISIFYIVKILGTKPDYKDLRE